MVANSLILQDTVGFLLNGEGETGVIIDGILFLYIDNGYPFDATIQLGLYDDNMNFLQNLTTVNQIKSAPLNGALKVVNKRESVIAIPLSSTDVDNLYLAKNILLKIGFTTAAQPQFIKIYEGYEIDIKMVGDFSYNVSLQ